MAKFDAKIVVLNIEESAPKAEVAADLIAIIRVFSSRVAVLRKSQKKTRDGQEITHLLETRKRSSSSGKTR